MEVLPGDSLNLWDFPAPHHQLRKQASLELHLQLQLLPFPFKDLLIS
jgi:hypothetical protein